MVFERSHKERRTRALGVLLLAVVTTAGCARRPDVAPTSTTRADPSGALGRRAPGGLELAAVYQQMGLVVGRGDVPFVASVAHFAARSSDSTLLLLSLSLANRALTFEREGDRYRAAYEVRAELRLGDSVVRRVAADEVVRVATFRETARADESVVFSQFVAAAPGAYTLRVAVRDAGGGRSTSVETPLTVPRTGTAGSLATPVIAYASASRARLDTLPDVTPRPRATATFGQDSVVSLYVEAYGDAGTPQLPLRVVARGERNALVWSDTASIARRGASSAPFYGGVVRVPVPRLGVGVVALDVVRTDTRAASDSARAELFVGLGEDLPAASFEEVLGYLRYYASPERLRALREAPPESRAAAWAAFLRASDPVSATPEHEGLRDYLARIRIANLRFDEGGTPGWMTDRGMTYIVLGEPDQIADPTEQDPNAKGRTQLWEYRAEKLQLTFSDRGDFGHWRLTGPSAAQVQAVMRRKLVP